MYNVYKTRIFWICVVTVVSGLIHFHVFFLMSFSLKKSFQHFLYNRWGGDTYSEFLFRNDFISLHFYRIALLGIRFVSVISSLMTLSSGLLDSCWEVCRQANQDTNMCYFFLTYYFIKQVSSSVKFLLSPNNLNICCFNIFLKFP